MAKKPKLGTGARFKQLKGKLASKGATNPGALAAYIGRKKYGAKKFAQLSAKGKKGRKEPEKGETKKHEKGESKSFEAKEKDRKYRKQGNVPMKNTVRVSPLATQGNMVNPMMKLKKAMRKVAKHG